MLAPVSVPASGDVAVSVAVDNRSVNDPGRPSRVVVVRSEHPQVVAQVSRTEYATMIGMSTPRKGNAA